MSNIESVPSNISYKSFKTYNLPMQNSYSPTVITETLIASTRLIRRRGLNFSSRMSVKQFHYCNKCLKIFQITLQTAKPFDSSDAMFAVISTLSNTSWTWVAISFHVASKT